VRPFDLALARLDRARESTLALVGALPPSWLTAQPDPEWSPIGWHLGHVAFTEALFILGRIGGDDSLFAPFEREFAQDGRAKEERSELPPRAELLDYMARVRARVRKLLPSLDPRAGDPLLRDAYVAWLVESHEHQHRETMAIVLGLLRSARLNKDGLRVATLAPASDAPAVRIPGGRFVIGTERWLAYDNERPPVAIELAPFELDAHPVTCGAWLRFMEDGGYERPELWTTEGWRWRTAAAVSAPLGWVEVAPRAYARARLRTARALDALEPVTGVSAHEADAFARYCGARLPTEAEWERAALDAAPGRALGLTEDGPVAARPGSRGPLDLLGNVWEWTASTFEPRPGFAPFPYEGYSVPYFGGTHRVCRGGSFATDPAIARPTFRNFYPPATRAIFGGLRCARNVD
jgi:iron(II)-dependent oxidoreductase